MGDNVKVTLTYEVPKGFYDHSNWWADDNFEFDVKDISTDFGYLTGIHVNLNKDSSNPIKRIKSWFK